MSLIISDDDPEEGEIIDDDFEDISDNSIIEPFTTGKFVSTKEHLPAISLSSVSDSDVPEKEDRKTIKIRHHHRPPKKKNKSFRRKKCSHNHKKHVPSDSDSDEFLDRKLHKQLKAAIHVDTEECHKNSLRTRLRAMTRLDENGIYEHISEKSENDNEGEKLKESSVELDDDLIQLRLEALRTAVLNKFEHRKKRKMKETLQNEDNLIEKVDKSEINKENTQLVNDSEPPNKKICNGKQHENEGEGFLMTPPDEDEDVLRALLLASMSKKITNEVIPTKTVLNTQTLTQTPKESMILKKTAPLIDKILPKVVTKKELVPFKNHLINKTNFKSHMEAITKMNPIIINVDDSDTDDDTHNTIHNIEKQTHIIPKAYEIESSVDKFLKEQRAKVEAACGSGNPVVAEKIEPSTLNKPIKSSRTNKFSKLTGLCKTNKINNTTPKPINTSVILEKSSVKLLPKNKQIEYQKLLLKLKNAERKPRTRRISSRATGVSQTGIDTSKKLVRNKMSVPVKNSVNIVEQNLDFKSNARTLHEALKEMQRQKNGRLQIEEKYVVLTPIIKKINEATTERKKYDQEVKRLVQELAEAKSKLRETQINFSTQVQELIKKKQEIESSPEPVESTGDQSKKAILRVSQMKDLPKNKKQKDVAFTSTPKRDHPPIESFEASKISSVTPNETPDNTISDSMKEILEGGGELAEEETLINVTGAIETLRETKLVIEMDGNNSDAIEVPINPGDPNDIDRIYKTQNVVPEYRSPLDCVKRKDFFDPLAIMCPYDVDGNCRDEECIYKHYSK